MAFSDPSHYKSTMSKIADHLDNQELCDVVLVVNSKRIPAHKLVLSSTSDYFHAMFNNNLRESSQTEVELNDIDPESLEDLVHYMYSGKVEIREDNVERILTTANILQLTPVLSAACDFLKNQLHPSNCLGIQRFADIQGCSDLHKSAYAYCMEHFSDVTQNREFLQLPYEQIALLSESDDVNIKREEDIFDAVLAWVQYDLEERKSRLPELLSRVRLTNVSKEFLADYVQANPLVEESLDCQHQVVATLMYHMMTKRCLPGHPPRKSTMGCLYAIGGIDSGKGAGTIERFDPREGQWSTFATMTGRRLQFGVAVLDEKLIIVGGRDGLKTLNSVECFNPQTKMWSSLPPVATHRHGLGVAELNGPLYAVGGHDGWSYLNTVERWDPQARTWSFVAPMWHPRSTLGIAILHEKLYAVGGRDGSSCLRSVERFDPHTNKWTSCAPMLKRRGGVGVGVCGGCIYAIGGHDAPASNQMSRLQETVDRYDPSTDQWTVVAPMSVPRDAVGICVMGLRLYACGGYDGQSYLDTCESYCPEKNEWRYEPNLNTGRAGTVVVHLKC